MNILYSIVGILIPFIGTSLGSFFVFFLRKNINKKFHNLMIGFASGVMLAASIWSLIMPSIELAIERGIIKWLPASVGLLSGVIFLIIINKITNNINKKNMNMLMFSVTLHNIPEGMAVGVAFAGYLSGNVGIDLMAAYLLALGIGIQNIPEGAIISMPLKIKGFSKKKSFLYGIISGIVELVSAIITIILLNLVVPLLPYLLSFAAGAMIYVVVEELIPEMQENKSILGIIGVTLGFILMMILDVMLG